MRIGSVGKQYWQTDRPNPEAVEPGFEFILMLRPPQDCTVKSPRNYSKGVARVNKSSGLINNLQQHNQ
jgi:hypothetical protein